MINSKNYVTALSVFTLCLGLNASLRAETSESRSLDQPGDLNRASKLLDKQVLGNDQQKLGKIRDFVFDFKTGKISYAVLGVPSGFLNSNEKLLAVPLRAFTPQRDKDSLVLNADKSNVEQAQAFDRYHWPDLGSSAWGAQPFWQDKNKSEMQDNNNDSRDQNDQSPSDSPKPQNQDNDSESPDRDMDQPAAALDSTTPQTIPAVKVDTANRDDDVAPVPDDDDSATDMEPVDDANVSDLNDPDNDDTDVDPATPDDNSNDMDNPDPAHSDPGINPDQDDDTDTSDLAPNDDDSADMDTPDPDQEPVDPGANQDDDQDDTLDQNLDSTDTTSILFVTSHLSSDDQANAEIDDDTDATDTDVADRETTSDTIPTMDMMGTATETNRLNSPANRHTQGTSTENNHTTRQSVMQQGRAGQSEHTQMSGKEPTRYNRAHSLIGMWVRNPQNQDLGYIKDLVIDFDKEQISYVVMAHSEILGLKEKLFAIPLTAFRPSDDQRYLMLDASKDSLKQAQGLTENTLPNVHSPSWGAQPFWKDPTSPALDTGVRPGTEPGKNRNNTQPAEPPSWQDY